MSLGEFFGDFAHVYFDRTSDSFGPWGYDFQLVTASPKLSLQFSHDGYGLATILKTMKPTRQQFGHPQ